MNSRVVDKAARWFPAVLGSVFLFAAVQKLLHPGSATMALESLDVPTGFARGLVASVIMLEFYLGALLLGRLDLRYALISASGLLLCFTVYLWYLTTLASPPSCGCLGLTGIFSNSRAEALAGLARNVLLLCLIRWSYDHLFPVNAPVVVQAPFQTGKSGHVT